MSPPPVPRTQAAKQEQYVLEQVSVELTRPWVLLSVLLVLVLLSLLAWRWVRRLPREARSTPLWRYGLYALLLAGGIAVTLGLPTSSRKPAPQAVPASEPTVTKAPPSPPPLPVPFSGELFRKLTWAPWIDVECERQGKTDANCWPWVFYPEGVYGRSIHPNALKRSRHDSYAKSWDVRASSDTSGVIATEEGNLMPFELQGADQMLLAGRPFRRAEEPLEGAEKAPLRKTHVAPLPILRGYEQLVSTPWLKVNPFDLDTQPESITFLPEGRFKASYRQGSCVHEGPLKVEAKKFFIEWGTNPCTGGAQRPPRFVSDDHPNWFLGEWLFLEDLYRPEKAPASPPMALVGDPKWGLFLKGQLSAELRKGVPNELVLSLLSTRSQGNLQLGELWVWLREAPSQGGEPRPRKEQVLFSKNLNAQPADKVVQELSERATFTPEFSGPAELEFELQITNPPWEWRKRLHRVHPARVGE
ncbi:hypothetical protein [Hyalangium gracile]|uniref:hypothetical protein n=1 Tax=Hyalangium gracile TaxID=394092 RepID=UPI001CCD8C0B|nr:hypothetical protein [Hyalangium gracile]